MKGLIHSLQQLSEKHRRCVVTIGNFDGVHRGHCALLHRLQDLALIHDAETMVILFEPQPLEFLRPEVAPSRIYHWQEKVMALLQKVSYVFLLKFGEGLAGTSAETFVEKYLVESLAVKAILVGDDFRFGHRRQGDVALLQKLGSQFGFEVTALETVEDSEGRLSSTRVREALAAGQLEEVRELLGRPYTLYGRVIHGEQRGRKLGFPTANIALKRHRLPLGGVYAVRVGWRGSKSHWGLANVGVRPTFDGKHPFLEVHLLDYQGDLYGKKLDVTFLYKLRDEIKFPSVAALIAQLEKDVQSVREREKLSVVGEDV